MQFGDVEAVRASGYEGAPATALVATCCAACGKALLDAASLSAGMGPDCRRRLLRGWPGLDEQVREQANRLIYEIAAEPSGAKVGERVNALRALGFAPLCDRIEKRLVTVRIERLPDTGKPGLLLVSFPYDEQANEGIRRVPGRRWREVPGRPGEKGNVIPNTRGAVQALHRVLADCFAGRIGCSPKGVFVIPDPEKLASAYGISRTVSGS